MQIYRAIGLAVAWLFRILLLMLGLLILYSGDAVGLILYLVAFILTLVPVMIEQVYDMKFHWIFHLAIAMLVSMHMIGAFGIYAWIPVYDDILHMLGSAVVAFIGFAIIFSMNYAGRVKVSLSSMGIFTFLWTMALGAVWEIIEFIWDNIVLFMTGTIVSNTYEFGFAQTSLFDTMTDLSFDGTMAVIVAILCVFLVRRMNKKAIHGFFNPFVNMIQHKQVKEANLTRKP